MVGSTSIGYRLYQSAPNMAWCYMLRDDYTKIYGQDPPDNWCRDISHEGATRRAVRLIKSEKDVVAYSQKIIREKGSYEFLEPYVYFEDKTTCLTA